MKRNNTLHKFKNMQLGDFSRDIFRLGSFTILGQFIGLLIQPVIARLYSPENFGEFGTFMAVTSLIYPLSSLKYNSAIVLANKKEEADNLYYTTILLNIILFIVVTLFFLFVSPLLTKSLNFHYSNISFLLLGVIFLLFSLGQLNKDYLNYFKQYGRIGSSVLTGRLGGIGYRLTDGFINPKSIGLILSEVFNLFLVNLLTFFKVSRLIGKLRDVKLNFSLQLIKKYKKFPLYEIPMDFLNFGAKKIPILLLAYYFDYVIVGYFVFAENILLKFVEIISKNIGQVYYKKIAESHDRKNVTILTMKTLFIIGFFPFVILGFAGKKLFHFVFGEQWGTAGTFCQILAGYLFLYFIFKSINSIYRIYNRQDKMLYFNIIYFVFVTLSIIIGGSFNNASLAIGLISISSCIVYLGIILYALNLIKVPLKKMIYSVLKNYSVFLISFIPFVFVLFYDLSILKFFLIIVISLCIYILLIFKYGLKEIKLFLRIK